MTPVRQNLRVAGVILLRLVQVRFHGGRMNRQKARPANGIDRAIAVLAAQKHGLSRMHRKGPETTRR